MKRFYGLTPRGSRRQADLFFADLSGERLAHRWPRARRAAAPRWTPPAAEPSPRYPRAGQIRPAATPAPAVDDDYEEAIPRGGRGRFRHEALGGEGDNVEARWNVDAATPAGSTIAVVVYLHGYGYPTADWLADKAKEAGLDMVDSTGAVRVRASQPTLALIPRGNHVRKRVWAFDALSKVAAFDEFVKAGLLWLCTNVLGITRGTRPVRGRLTLMAHSGGGATVSALLEQGLDPDEVICFDSLYGGEKPIQEWAAKRIDSPHAARSGLRAFYTPCSAPSRDHPAGRWVQGRDGAYTLQNTGSWEWRDEKYWRLVTTEVWARRLHHALQDKLAKATGGAALANRFRVQRTSVRHDRIPGEYAPLLLENINADVPRASVPPPATSLPACVATDGWRKNPPVVDKPGGMTAPPPKPSASAPAAPPAAPAAEAPAAEEPEDAYAPPNARPYPRNTSAALFRTPPDPVAITAASEWPAATTDADGASERALRALGVTAAAIRPFAGAGMTALRPIASAFGEAALTELLRRLRYSPAQLARPPHSYDREADLTHAFGKPVPRPAILAMRTLLAIPGHFRELARLAGSEDEAYALENLGWLLLQSLRDEVRTSSGFDFWLPASPAFVTKFAAATASLSPQLTQLVAARMLTDATVDAAAYRARFIAWQSGAPGRTWRLETGRETSTGRSAGAPFYPNAFTIPASINITAERAQVAAAWRRRVADFDAGRTTKTLSSCDNTYLTALHVVAPISLRGLQLRGKFPSPPTARTLTELNGLAAVRPAFEAAFQAIVDLGWNDLVFETQGLGCFRGKKIPGRPAAARNMSEHSLGIAIDLNVFENGQNTAGSMDPRIVALFEAFRFRWGKGFSTPDPMHFEYAG